MRPRLNTVIIFTAIR